MKMSVLLRHLKISETVLQFHGDQMKWSKRMVTSRLRVACVESSVSQLKQ